MYINREPEKNNAVSHKVWAIFRAGFFASKTTGVSPGGGGGHFHIEGVGDVPLARVWFCDHRD